MQADDRNKITGKRLDECLKRKHITAKHLADISGEKRDPPLSEQYISQMRRGKRAINYSNAALFSECLDIDRGYLLGDDDYKAENYDEYLGIMKKTEKRKTSLPELEEHAKVIELAGYSLYVNYNASTVVEHPGGSTTKMGYTSTITNGNHSARITMTAMRKITKRVKSYAADLYDAEVLRNQIESYDTGEEFERERKKLLKKASK